MYTSTVVHNIYHSAKFYGNNFCIVFNEQCQEKMFVYIWYRYRLKNLICGYLTTDVELRY